MSYLPKFLYMFRNTLVTVIFFTKLERVISPFIWVGQKPRLAKTILQLPLTEGGLALPRIKFYYWAAVLATVRWWFEQQDTNPAVNLEAALLGSYSELINLVYRGPQSNPNITIPMKTTIFVWREVTRALSGDHHNSPHTPLWGNPSLTHLRTALDPRVWAGRGVKTLQHVMPEGQLLSSADLRGFIFIALLDAFQIPATETCRTGAVP